MRLPVPLAVLLTAAAVAGCAAPGARPASSRLVAPPAAAAQEVGTTATSPSWNSAVRCGATVTTLRTLLGTQRSAQGGATFSGGGFRPGIPDRRALTPPCAVDGRPTFVELRRVVMGSCSKINKDGDWTCKLRDPAYPTSSMNRLHVETGRNVRATAGWSTPPGGTPIDVQGFVFWDPGHTGAAWHDYSGWELHSLTAWRRAR